MKPAFTMVQLSELIEIRLQVATIDIIITAAELRDQDRQTFQTAIGIVKVGLDKLIILAEKEIDDD